MHKLLLAGVSVLALGVSGAMAQQATILDDGNSNVNLIDQTGAGAGYTANITQVPGANNNTADIIQVEISPGVGASVALTDIRQEGDRNDANVIQADGDGVQGASLVDVDQGGNDNTANVFQVVEANTATVDQSGNDNIANVTQVGRLLTASVAQSGNDNTATLSQFNFAEDIDADITQTGNDNTASIFQDGNTVTFGATSASVTQNGNDGTSTIFQ